MLIPSVSKSPFHRSPPPSPGIRQCAISSLFHPPETLCQHNKWHLTPSTSARRKSARALRALSEQNSLFLGAPPVTPHVRSRLKRLYYTFLAANRKASCRLTLRQAHWPQMLSESPTFWRWEEDCFCPPPHLLCQYARPTTGCSPALRSMKWYETSQCS